MWRTRSLADLEPVILAVESGHRESTESWRTVLRDLQRRGLRAPRVVVGDGHLGIWGALSAVFPTAAEQGCWNHPAPEAARQAAHAPPGRGQERAHEDPVCRKPRGGRAAETGVPDLGHQEGRRRRGPGPGPRLGPVGHLLSVPEGALETPADDEPDESPFAAVRLRTTAAKRFKRVENATAVIWKTLLVAEQTLRRLDAPELLAEVAEGVTYIDGERVKPSRATVEEKAAA